MTPKKQRMVLKGQHLSLITAGFLQGSIFGHQLFLTLINDLSEVFNSNPKLFAGDNFLFSVAKDISLSQIKLNKKQTKTNN